MMATEVTKEAMGKTTFNELKKDLRDIKYRSDKDWEIFLPFPTSSETVQKIVQACREKMELGWHIVFGDVTEENPAPETRVYWDK